MKKLQIRLLCAVAVAVWTITPAAFAAPKRSAPESGQDTVTVKARGVGIDKNAALKDAYRDAVERAVGLYVDAESAANNDELVEDKILTHSNAYIEKYDEIDTKKIGGGLIQIRIAATVKKSELAASLKKVSLSRTANKTQYTGDLKDIHAQIVSKEKRDADGAALLQNALKGIDPCTLLAVPSVDMERKKVIKGDAISNEARCAMRGKSIPNGQVVLRMLLRLKFDEGKYYNSFVPTIKPVLDQIASSSKKVKLSLFSDPREEGLTAMEEYLSIGTMDAKRPRHKFVGRYELPLNQEPCMSPMRVLYGGGYLLRMEAFSSLWGDKMGLEDVVFSSAGSSHGGAGWPQRYRNGRLLRRNDDTVCIDDVVSKMNRSEASKGQSPIQLILVCGVNKAHTVWDAVFYQVDKRTAAAFMIWCGKYGSGNSQSWPEYDRNTAAEIVQYNVSYCDKNGDAVLMNTWRIPRICLMNADWGSIRNDFGPIRILYISPFFGCSSEEYVQWHDALIKTDMLQEIESVNIEMDN